MSQPLLHDPDPRSITALAPSGTLRAAINLSNFLLVSSTGADGTPTGVSPSMAAALADSLGVELSLITFPSPGVLADAVADDCWDIGNIGADPARSEHIVFTSPYAEIDCTYLVRGDSTITTIDEVDRPGNRVATKARSAYSLWLERNIEQAELIQTPSIDESFRRFIDDRLDVLAGLRPRLLSDARRLPGSRLIAGRFMAVQQAIGTPRRRDPQGVEYLERFVVEAIRSGLVAELIAEHGAEGLSVAAMPTG